MRKRHFLPAPRLARHEHTAAHGSYLGRYSVRMNLSASGQFLAHMASPSQSRLLPARSTMIGAWRACTLRDWREIGELVRKAKHPLHLKDFCQHIGTKDMSRAAHHVRKAEQAGLMPKIERQGGWVVVE